MGFRYLYIDDDDLKTSKMIASGLSTTPAKLKVTATQPKLWSAQLNFLVSHQDAFDGLLVDWNLSKKSEQDEIANFHIEALAQQIRRSMLGPKLFEMDFPIVLCSAEANFEETFSKELTGHDLFDLVYEKHDFDQERDRVKREMISMANGYQRLQSSNELLGWLGLDSESLVDETILGFLESLQKKGVPTHEYARFIFSKLIMVPNPLIDENLLAAKLGVDFLESGKEWPKFLQLIKSVEYSGIFSDGWKRWWLSSLFRWWNEHFETSLGNLSGPVRTQRINQKFGLALVAASKLPYCTSDYFWTVCEKSKKPIALEDGLLIAPETDSMEWAEDRYISIDCAILESRQIFHPLEWDRLAEYKERYTRVRAKKSKR